MGPCGAASSVEFWYLQDYLMYDRKRVQGHSRRFKAQWDFHIQVFCSFLRER